MSAEILNIYNRGIKQKEQQEIKNRSPKERKQMKIFKKITIVSILLIIMLTYTQTLVFAAESELTLTPKPETNNIHLKWTGPQNSSYKVYQKKPGASSFETIGLTDFSNNATDEEVKVLNIYPTRESINPIILQSDTPFPLPDVNVTYDDR